MAHAKAADEGNIFDRVVEIMIAEEEAEALDSEEVTDESKEALKIKGLRQRGAFSFGKIGQCLRLLSYFFACLDAFFCKRYCTFWILHV